MRCFLTPADRTESTEMDRCNMPSCRDCLSKRPSFLRKTGLPSSRQNPFTNANTFRMLYDLKFSGIFKRCPLPVSLQSKKYDILPKIGETWYCTFLGRTGSNALTKMFPSGSIKYRRILQRHAARKFGTTVEACMGHIPTGT